MWSLFVGVGSEQEARVAVEQVGADVVVAQGKYVEFIEFNGPRLIARIAFPTGILSGIEAGGHGNGSSPPLSTLLPHIARLLPTYQPLKREVRPLVLGAGGLSAGSHLVSCLALGAVGAVYGTRFLLTPESCYPEPRKQILLEAGEGSTIRSMAFDEARNTLDWPPGVNGRGIRNETVDDYEAGLSDEAGRQDTYSRAEKKGDANRLIVWAGTGVGNMNKISPAGQVVRELEQEALQSMERVRSMSV
jgi:nitronate monooxygenase